MTHLPHWNRAAAAMQAGILKFAIANPASTVSDGTIAALAKFMVGINGLADFSTRDYAYDRGGDTLTAAEVVGHTWICVWVREDGVGW
jgi:hypothetical protein